MQPEERASELSCVEREFAEFLFEQSKVCFASRQGYRWRVIGENIAAGLGSPQQVVAGWLASPAHCANILSPDFTEMSAAYAINDEAAMEIYWTQVFGRR